MDSGLLLNISCAGTSEREERESISSAGHEMKSKHFFLTFISHRYFLCVIECQMQKWYGDLFLQVK